MAPGSCYLDVAFRTLANWPECTLWTLASPSEPPLCCFPPNAPRNWCVLSCFGAGSLRTLAVTACSPRAPLPHSFLWVVLLDIRARLLLPLLASPSPGFVHPLRSWASRCDAQHSRPAGSPGGWGCRVPVPDTGLAFSGCAAVLC